MNGSLQIKKTKAGNEYYYTVIELYDELGRRKPKWEATGLPVKGNKRKAEALLQKRIQECEGQINHTDSNLLFGDWIEQWLNSVKGQIEMSTWEGYYFPVQHVKKYFNAQKLKLNDLKPIHFDTYYTYMLTKGKCDGENPKGYAIKTVRQHKLVINLALQKAVYLEIISHNPADGIKVTNHKSKDLAKPIKFLSLKESQDLLAYLYDTGDELADVVKAVLFFGLRKSELLGIKEDAIDFKKKKLHISHTIVKVKTTYEKDRTKTSSSRRSYDLNDEMIDFLKKMVEKKRKTDYFTAIPILNPIIFSLGKMVTLTLLILSITTSKK